jgi:hypothetical protein
MNTMRRSRKLAVVTLAVLALVLVVSAPSHARGMGGHGFGGGHHGGGFVHHGLGGHPGFHRGFGFGPVYPYYGYYGYYPPAEGYAAPGYWYYCPSYGAYYPSVGSCPEAWVLIPAS